MNSAFIPFSTFTPLSASRFVSRSHVVAPHVSATASTPTMLFGKSGGRGRRIRGPGGMGGNGNRGAGRRSGGMGSGGSVGGGGGRTGAGGGSGFMSGDSNPFKAARAFYLAQIRKNPIVAKMVTSFVGFAAATLVVGSGDEPDWNEALRNGLVGAVVHGLGGHYYYGATERAMPGQAPGNVIGKTVIDFFLAVPFITISLGIFKVIMNDKGLGDVVDHITSSWKIPPPIWSMWSCLNMYVAPMDERVLFYNAVIVFSACAKKLADASLEKEKEK